MTVKTAHYDLKTGSPLQKVYSGRFTGINGVAPTTYTTDPGIAITRSGEGVYVITLPSPLKGFKSVIARATSADGNAHDINWTLSASARTITVTHRTAAFTTMGLVTVKGRLADVSAADAATTNRAYAVSPVAGTIAKIQAQVVSGGALNGDAVVTNNIGGVAITNGAITLPNTSAVGTVVAVTPTAANTVAVGDILTGVTDGGGSTSAGGDVTYTITPTSLAAEDVIDEIDFIAIVEIGDCGANI